MDMDAQANGFLNKAEGLIRSGRGKEAVKGLVDYVNRNPQSEEGWFMLSQVVSDLRQKEDCLRQVLKINPRRKDARDRLNLLLDLSRSPGKQVGTVYSVPAANSTWNPSDSQRWGEESVLDGGLRARKLRIFELVQAYVDRLTGIRKDQVKPWQAAIPYLLIGLALFGCLLTSGTFLFIRYEEHKLAWSATQTQVHRFILPPTWTPTPIPPPTETPAPTPTRTPTPSPTFPVPGPTSGAAISTIQVQVSELRSLSMVVTAPVHLGERARIAEVMAGMLEDEPRFHDMQVKAKSLYVLGLIPEGYDLSNYLASSFADGLGGFYHPRKNEIYITGRQLSAIERYNFAHEFTHALTAANFNSAYQLLDPLCRFDHQRCTAYQSLVEGDAVLVSQQWLDNKAGPEVYRQLINNLPAPGLFVPDPSIPPALLQDLLFPYTHGLAFVKILYSRGGWGEVDRAYLDPPQTTEQILHPDKYLRREGALVVEPYKLDYGLGAGWRLTDWGVLGEWETYLILAHGVDPGGRMEDEAAASAAAGWGGDIFQLFEGPVQGEWVMVVQWVWDSPGALSEFENALGRRLAGRIEASPLPGLPIKCWEAGGRVDCVRVKDGEVVWMVSPDIDLMLRVLTLIP
jgi:hypothetical protein